MYSRNKGGENYPDDGYELYDFGLPPRYDGNRFRRTSRIHSEEKKPCPPDIVYDEKAEASPDGILHRLGEKLGEEELLIIALMLAVASGGAPCDDVLLLLAFLLICK